MEAGIDFVDCFQNDVACKIMSCLDDSADLIRATAVSRSWCHFDEIHLLITNGLFRKMCCKKVPALATTDLVVEENDGIVKLLDDVVLRNSTDWETLEKEHKIYCALLQVLAKPIGCPEDCTALTVGVLFSKENDPAEIILNIPNPLEKSPYGYFSTKPNVPEHIIYQLKTPTCIVKEILILHCEDRSLVNLRHRWPIYSGKSVRFRMGHPKSVVDLVEMGGTHVRPPQQPSLDNYVWTYTSPVFSMDPDSDIHKFTLPEPIICMGGFLHIEVLDKVQREENREYLYICLGYVCIWGFPLEPAFKLEMLSSEALKLKHFPHALQDVLESGWFHRAVPSITDMPGFSIRFPDD